MRVHPPVKAENASFAVEYGPRTYHNPWSYRVHFEAQSVDNLPPCNLHGLLSKNMEFESKVGHYIESMRT
jgi:hypothetical protein